MEARRPDFGGWPGLASEALAARLCGGETERMYSGRAQRYQRSTPAMKRRALADFERLQVERNDACTAYTPSTAFDACGLSATIDLLHGSENKVGMNDAGFSR